MVSSSPRSLARIAAGLAVAAQVSAPACAPADSDPDAQQRARVNADIARLIARVDALERRLDGAPGHRGAAAGETASGGAGVMVQLPQATAPDPAPTLVVTVDAPDAPGSRTAPLRVGGAPVTLEALGERFAAHAAKPGAQVTVRAAPAVPYARVAEILDLARARGIARIAIAPAGP